MKFFFLLLSCMLANVTFAHDMQLFTDDHTHANKGQRSDIPLTVSYDDTEISLEAEEYIGVVLVIVRDVDGEILHITTVYLSSGAQRKIFLEPDKNEEKYTLEIYKDDNCHYGFF